MTNTKTRTEASVETGSRIVRKAISKKISLSEASRQSNKGRNYVSDIKARLNENYKNKNVGKEAYNEFKSLIKKYESIA